jgi:adenylate cyclase
VLFRSGGGKLDFTVIGDTVNTASRVEKLTRETGDDVLITEATRGRLTRPGVEWEERAEAVRGKADPVRVCRPLAAGSPR